MAPTATAEDLQLRDKQLKQAEELFFSGPQKEGFAKDLFFGRFRAESILPYPRQSPEERAIGDEMVANVRKFAENELDPDRIDREADIPPETIRRFGELGVLGATVNRAHGGRGMSQFNYCRVMEIIGGRCGGSAVFVNAHHSIGLRALELFGTEEQKRRWMRPLATGEELAAFALTEEQAGSDAGNVRTLAQPTPDGSGYILNGGKRYITNGGIAQVLTVMARTPDDSDPDGKVTAFLVTPDMPGFQVLNARMEKTGIRGTATAKLAFNNMFVPKENVLGQVGKGLRIALTVLDFGRTTFGASCTGAAKFCVQGAVDWANKRRQFGKSLGEFDLIREKIARMAADTFAMESATYHTAALIDSGSHDYMLETSMLKVFASDRLWDIVNETLQIYGGAGFFTDQPWERMMRDARLNLIGEGANEVLRCFNAMVGLRNLGKELESILKKPWQAVRMWRPAPTVPVTHAELQPAAKQLSKQIQQFSRACQRALIKHREGILDRQLVQGRLGDTATELFVASCVLSRLSGILDGPDVDGTRERSLQTGLYYMASAARRNSSRLRALRSNDDALLNEVAERWLK